jgi:hypothetical protein
MSWPNFGFTTTPNADNNCVLLSNVLAGHLEDELVRRAPVDLCGFVVNLPPAAWR